MVSRRKTVVCVVLGALCFFLTMQLMSDNAEVPQNDTIVASPTQHRLPPSPAPLLASPKHQQRHPVATSPKSVHPANKSLALLHQKNIVTSTSISAVRHVVSIVTSAPKQPVQHQREPIARIVSQKRGRIELIHDQLNKGSARLNYHKMVRVFQNAMSHYPVVPKESVQRVLIVTYFRSGSTFLGDILQSNPRCFYHFEPLHMYSNDARLEGPKAQDGVALVKRILQCQFKKSNAYMKWVQKEENQFLFRRNRFLWSHFGSRSPLYFRTEYVTRLCERAPLHVMKITRLSVAQVKELAQDKQFGPAKIVHLVRDPRGILSSRKLLDWCKSSNCSDYGHLCNEMRSDLDAFDELQRTSTSQVFRVRYEDVSLNPENETRSLFKGLGLPYSANILMFLKTHTSAHKVDALNPYSTRRNSSTVPFQWMKKLDFDYIQEVQKSCKDVLFRLGYKIIDNTGQLDGPLPIGPIPETSPGEISNPVHREVMR